MLTDAEIDDLLEEKIGVRIMGGFRRLDYKAYRAIYDRACDRLAQKFDEAGDSSSAEMCRKEKHSYDNA